MLNALAAAALGVGLIFDILGAMHFGRTHWGITEWLINYSGGFVRRGLPGQTLLEIGSHFSLAPNLLAIAVSVLAYAALLAFFMASLNDRLAPYVIMSPALAGVPALSMIVVRKDSLLLMALVAGLAALRRPGAAGVVFSNAVAMAAVLSHETFGFYALPALILFHHGRQRRAGATAAASLLRSAASFSPSLLAFALALIFHGDKLTAVSINETLASLWRAIDPTDCCPTTPSAAIEAIGYTFADVKNGLWPSAPIAFAWMGSALAVFYFLCAELRVEEKERIRLAGILVAQAVFILPLFVMGWDYGRWIFFWTTSSMALYIFAFDPPSPAKKAAIGMGALRVAPYLESKGWMLLFLGMPGCCLSLHSFFSTSVAGVLVTFASMATSTPP